MNAVLLFIVGLCISAIAIIVIVSIRLFLIRKSKELSLRLNGYAPYQTLRQCRKISPKKENECVFIDIETDLNRSFDKQFITYREAKQFSDYYTELFNEVNAHLKRVEIFHVESSEILADRKSVV